MEKLSSSREELQLVIQYKEVRPESMYMQTALKRLRRLYAYSQNKEEEAREMM